MVFPSLEEFSIVCCDLHEGFGMVNKAEVDVFVKFSCFDPVDVANLISGSFDFSTFSLNIWKFIWKFTVHALEKEMATHSSILAWRIPGTGEPGGLPSLGSHRLGHN